jgi:uncharacterized repeat protein (TIGR03803 family)
MSTAFFACAVAFAPISVAAATQPVPPRLGATKSIAPSERRASLRPNVTSFTSLHSFGATTKDGTSPGGVLLAQNGLLYGTTYGGGGKANGTVYSLTTGGVVTVLHSFGGIPDGAEPAGGLIYVNGTFYGTTALGGTAASGYSSGCGTVFEIPSSGKERVLHRLVCSTNGADPSGTLLDVDGVLYGTASMGGARKNGTIFAVYKDGTMRNVYAFGAPPDGETPVGSLVDLGGTLYGTTSSGGAEDYYGTVFSLSTSGTESVIRSFDEKANGGDPQPSLVAFDGEIYGTTAGGGAYNDGTVFELSPTGKETVIYSFSGGADGGVPNGSLVIQNGLLYGTTSVGGAGSGAAGTVFSLTPTGSLTVLHTFTGADGANPAGGLTPLGSAFYGTTAYGGLHNLGTVYAIVP